MAGRPVRAELPERLKQLHDAQPPMPVPGFGVDDVIRRGRSRRRRRTATQWLAAVVAVATIGTGVTQLDARRNDDRPVQPAVVPASPPSTRALPAVNLAEDGSLTYRKTGPTVTITRSDGPVGTLTLTSAQYTEHSGHVVFTLTTTRDLTVDTGLFVLYSSDGGENSAEKERTLHLRPGSHSLVLDFQDTGANPEAVGWAAANGDAVWARADR